VSVATGPAAGGTAPAVPPEHVALTVDGVGLQVPKGTLVIRAAEMVGVAVPRFCDHPLLDPVAACRMCLVEIEGQGKPQPACAVTVAEGMAVHTQVTSEVARLAQQGIMELLLINHPLDCPICDKGGECPLQNQSMANGHVRVQVRRGQAHVPQARQRVRADPAGPGAVHLVRSVHTVLPSRSPATRSSSCSSAVRTSRSAPATTSRSTPTSPATPCRCARSER
jgi:NADH-quinone oxidoreductase subunit G